MKLQVCHRKVFLPLSLIMIGSGIVTALPEPTQNNREPSLISGLKSIAVDTLSLAPIDDIISGLNSHPEISNSFPGLLNTLVKVRNKNITAEDYVRGLLKSIQSHAEFKKGFGDLGPDLQKDVNRFMAGEDTTQVIGKRSEFFLPPSPAVKEHFRRMEDLISGEFHVTKTSRRAWLNAKRQTSPVIYEDEARTKVMKVHISAPFHNWGLTVHNTPLYTFVPTTIYGLENLSKYAKSINKRIRASGYRHSWAPIFSSDGEILVSMLDLDIATAVPDPMTLLPDQNHAGNEFKVIQLAEKDVPGKEGKNRYVRVGAAVTNEEFRRWAVRGDDWAMPANTLIVEVTLGGTTAPMCHGGGIRHKTISDLIRKIEYVDANGIRQYVTNPEQLKAAAGSFGLLGIITHITLELDKMTYATMQPKKIPVNFAIPPPLEYIRDEKIPGPLRGKILENREALGTAMTEFVDRATKDYYSEWFWFPYQNEAWVNTWNTTTDKTGVSGYPTPPDVFFQWIQGWLGGVMNESFLFRALPGYWQGVIMGTLGHLVLPPYGPIYETIRTSLPDALHMRRGLQNMRVSDLELEIPIPASSSDPTKPDYSVVQKAWWDAIIATYQDKKAPLRSALEMKMMGGSDLIMATQRGNKFGTASIQIVTTMAAVDDGSWAPYAQRVMDKWMDLVDGNGAKLKTRPHWAKEWDGMTVYGRPWREYLKTVAYKDAIPEFKAMVKKIGKKQGWTLSEAQARFSNELWDDLIFSKTSRSH